MRSLTLTKTAYLRFLINEYVCHTYILIPLAAMVCIFAFDLYSPLGVAAGTPYALLVFGTLWIKGNHCTYIIAALGLALTLVGFYLSPTTAVPLDIVIINRILAVLLILSTMIMVLKTKKAFDRISILKTQTFIDPLTQCKNKFAFEKELDFEILRNKRYKRNLTIGIFNINEFKFLTFSHGKDNGSQIIKRVSQEIQNIIRNTDLVYRIDTDKFAILFSETNLPKAKEVSTMICRNIANNKNNNEVQITLNAGLASLDADDSKEKLYKRAEDALLISQKHDNDQVSTLPDVSISRSPVPAILSRPRSDLQSQGNTN
jgi:diguanylate cyclase (GGDEF)-like protein